VNPASLRLPVQALGSADRWRRGHLGSVAGVTRRIVGSAAGNASRALEEIAGAIDDRRHLLPAPELAQQGDLVVLSPEECMKLLMTRSTGRLAYIARAGVPDIVPVNYLVHQREILIRSGPGPKLQAAQRRDMVAFEVDDIDEVSHNGWSVVVIGRAAQLVPQRAALMELPESWASGPRWHTLSISPTRIAGRRLL
jgi:nitroimidazol reductase NimA-like FMN-containing flavoprotein (pyridoxamine 5'-phosphate oxidase superfamily)